MLKTSAGTTAALAGPLEVTTAVAIVVQQVVVVVTGAGSDTTGRDGEDGDVQRVVVVPRLAVADGWGTAGVDWEIAGQVEMLPDNGQHTHTAVLAELVVTAVVAIVVQCVVVVTPLNSGGVDEDGDVDLKYPRGLEIIFPS